MQQQSVVKQVESGWNDWRRLWKRKPLVALLILLFLVAPASLLVIQHFWGNGELKEKLSQNEKELADVKRDRDAKATQLAPFLALAQKTFTDAPPDERLKLLIQRVEILEKSYADTQPRVLSTNAIHAAEKTLAQLQLNLTWWVRPEFADFESATIVRQISDVLLVAGSGHVLLPGTLPTTPVKGIRVQFSPGLAPVVLGISNVFVELCRDMNRPLTLVSHNDLAATNGLAVTVGTR
jgi:hypothetical protein